MKTSFRAALTILALPLFWTNPSRADGYENTPSTSTAHRVTLASAGGNIVEAEPNDPPSTAHPEGTVFALVYTNDASTSNVVEVDVKTGAELHRAPLVCRKILREKSSLFAICGDEVIEMDRTLAPVTRYATRHCAAGQERRDIKLVSDHTSRVVALYMCAGALQLTIVDTTEHRVRSNVSTNLFPWDQRYSAEETRLYFHGTAISGWVPGPLFRPSHLFALSADSRRVVNTLELRDGESFEDDGAHLHLSLEHESLEHAREMATSDPDDKAKRPTPPRGLPWLTLDRGLHALGFTHAAVQ
jgi:hypothetical protein